VLIELAGSWLGGHPGLGLVFFGILVVIGAVTVG
jgi:hypothetical protein